MESPDANINISPSDQTGVGSPPDLKGMTPQNRSINSVNQGFSVCETMVNDWKKGILNAARITAKLNGERPYNQKKLKDAAKDWKSNVSTGFLSTECRKIQPRLHMPIKTAKYLTAASLPANWPDGAAKSSYFRECITEAVRGWTKFNFYLRGLAREVGVFGFAFNCWFDEWEWRPSLLRMDKGFVPQGTEVGEEPQFFLAKYDYSPDELFGLLKNSLDAGGDSWKKDNVIQAIKTAAPIPIDATYPNSRVWEELIRQASWGWRYTKGARMIRTYHLFAKEVTGKVSHYILLAEGYTDGANSAAAVAQASPVPDKRLLFEALDQFDSMSDAVGPMVFDFGDGTIHGSWGAGQILYDLAAQVEKIRCDSIDNMRNSNKMKLQVPDAKNVSDVKLSVTDTFMIVSGGEFAGNEAAMPQNMEGYELLDNKLTQIAQQKIGAFVPPIPLQPSDIKAAQINAALSKEKELQEDVLENWLIQFAQYFSMPVARRLCKDGSPDATAQEVRKKLLTRLTAEEIDMLCNEFPVQSVIDFTEYRAQQRAAFAASVKGDPLFRQAQVARVMAEGVGDEKFVNQIVVPEGDQSDLREAQSKQLLENAGLAIGQQMPVLVHDNDWVHMQTMKPGMDAAAKGGKPELAELALQHYAAHYSQGVAKKGIPNESINEEKKFIAMYQDLINAQYQQKAIKDAGQQAMAHADAHAQQIVAQEQAQGQGPEQEMA